MKFYSLNIVFIFSLFIFKSFSLIIKNDSTTTPHHIINWSLNADELRNITLQKIEEEKYIIEEIEQIPELECSFENVVVPLIDKVENEITFYSYYFYLLENVAVEKEIRQISAECYSEIEEFNYFNIWTNKNIFDKILAVKTNISNNIAKQLINDEDKRLLEQLINEFHIAGLDLSDADSEKLNELDMKIGNLEYAFTDCIYEDETTVSFTKEELEGIPERVLEGYDKEIIDGKEYYILNTLTSTLKAVAQYAKNENTRKKMSIVSGQRCKGNLELLKEAVNLRYEKAKLLGYNNYSEYKLQDKMAKNPENVIKFLDSLKEKLQPVAQEELNQLLELKKLEKMELNEPFNETIYDWELEYYKRQLLEKEYTINDNIIREYFPMTHVINEIFKIYEELFSLTFKEIENPSVWTTDVRQFEIYDQSTKIFMGTLYLDLYPRQGKYNHMANYSVDYGYVKKDGSRNYPIAAMVTNFSKPTENSPSLLTHKEVINYFHELGHALHQICSITKWSRFNGMNIEPDFVEGPAQMLEYFVWESEILKRISYHYKDQIPLSDEIIETIIKSKNFSSGTNNLKQILYAYADIKIHSIEQEDPTMNLYEIWNNLKKEITMMEPMETWPIAVFEHIMSGYDVNYYGYLWSQVYAADMFSQFKTYGVLNKEIGQRYRNVVLSKGSTENSMTLIKNFLFREPNDDAFLKTLGF
ncbi:zincin [Anaeromyces robustus]|uniref:Zincin n=1 Tax=Anaeromyces robustus TaxID=1754192 RepID=A0A1Y1VTJ2_9FUNG|nr:zincin [Anaeromyces robustus]|eukprot:ORX64607.1 zincin [Anaeromyces robustus]